MSEAGWRLSVKPQELDEVLERARAALGQKDYELLKAVVETLAYLTRVAEDRHTTIRQLRRLLFGSGSEKTRDVLILLQQIEAEKAEETKEEEAESAPMAGADEEASSSEPGDEQEKQQEKKRKRRPGHGRNGADAYRGAHRIPVPHGSLRNGDRCPGCLKGKVYEQKNQPQRLIRIVGQSPVEATIYELERLRCNLCGEVFSAEAPDGVGTEKYDATAGAMIALLKYGSGVPFFRLEKLQNALGIPLPASTQWEVVEGVAQKLAPAYAELIRQAAQGEVLHNDDTAMKVLELNGRKPEPSAKKSSQERTGVFTSAIMSTQEGRQIAVFFTGRRHAGENLGEVLRQRAADLAPPIQMCDALSRNLPRELEVILANCLAHARRQVIDVAESFPAECRHVLLTLAEVYKNDELTREQSLSPEQRLSFHQQHSAPLLDELHKWLNRQLRERLVEPNSGLGRAIRYFLGHWDALTLFLRRPGAPLDNNLCERALKKVILHRKNALFFKTLNGAHVGDLFLSLIHSCQLSGANPFDYLTELQKHAAELRAKPDEWMPWNYRDTMARDGPA